MITVRVFLTRLSLCLHRSIKNVKTNNIQIKASSFGLYVRLAYDVKVICVPVEKLILLAKPIFSINTTPAVRFRGISLLNGFLTFD